MYIKVLHNIKNNKKSGGVVGGAIFEPKSLSSYSKKNRMTETGLEPTTFGLENLPSCPLG